MAETLTLDQQKALALASARARMADAEQQRGSASAQQPTFLQNVMASPGGRLVHDAVISPIEGLASLALHTAPMTELRPLGDALDNAVANYQEKPYQEALAAQRKRPGYIEARAKADEMQQLNPNAGGFTEQVVRPFLPGLSGIAGGLLGGSYNAANATADAQTAALDQYSKEHPILSTAGQVLGGFIASPGRGPLPAALPAVRPAAKVPTIADLKKAAQTAYQAVDNSGMVISGNSVGNMVGNLKTVLAREGLDPTLHPNTTRVLSRLEDAAGSDTTMQGMDTLRKITSNGIDASVANKSDRRLLYAIQNKLDDFVNGLQPTDVIGPVDQGAIDSLSQARDLWSRASKAEIIQRRIDRAQVKAGQYSQSGVENALRTEFRSLALNDRVMSRFTPAEQKAIKRVAKGGPVREVLRLVGKFAPHGVVSTALGAGTGFAAGGPAGAVALPLAGEGARLASTALTKSAARKAVNTALLGRNAPLPVNQPILQIPALPATNMRPYGIFGSGIWNQQPQAQ